MNGAGECGSGGWVLSSAEGIYNYLPFTSILGLDLLSNENSWQDFSEVLFLLLVR